MTLIIGFASPEFAMILGDRVITWPDVHGTRTYVEQLTKLVSGGGLLFGFAGAADLGMEDETPDWLMEKISEVEQRPELPAQFSKFLVDEMSQEVWRRYKPVHRTRNGREFWISVLMVGFQNVVRDGTGRVLSGDPLLAVFTNSKTKRYGHTAVRDPKDIWSSPVSVKTPNDEFKLWAIGSVPDRQNLEDAAKVIHRYRRRYPDRSREIAKILTRLIVGRSFQDPGVGYRVQMAIMPIGAAHSRGVEQTVSFREPTPTATLVFQANAPIDASGAPVFDGIGVVSNGMIFSHSQVSVSSGDDLPDELPPPVRMTRPAPQPVPPGAYPRCPNGDGMARLCPAGWMSPDPTCKDVLIRTV